MGEIELSVLIPARNEEWLGLTIQDVLTNSEANIEVIVILDGYIPEYPLIGNDKRVTLIYNPQSKGQRAATNQAAKLARGKYLMKLDAHCALGKGFDRIMLEGFKITGDNVTMIPVMKNLHVWDWICPDSHRTYQGKSNICHVCQKECSEKDVLWLAKPSPNRFTFTFDKTMHFQYWGELAKRPESLAQGQYRETMSIQGSCFMLTKEKYFALDICSEDFHSWGQQGVEVACKTWLSGGKVIANLNTWYAHMFRTNNFGGFPYSNPESLIQENRELSRELFQRNKWPLAIHTFQWLLDKFNPPEWGTLSKGIIYYTDSELDEKIANPVRQNLQRISEDKRMKITSSSLKKLDFGRNIHFPSLRRGHEAMFKQILGALENSDADIIFFTEHDVMYHPSHFDFTPEDKNIFYFNNNVWKLDIVSGHALKVDKCEQLSGMCVYRETALNWVREKIEEINLNGFDRHFEPQNSVRGAWQSEQPNVDIRHSNNLTPNRWSKEQFRNQDNTKGWIESENFTIPGWNSEILKSIV